MHYKRLLPLFLLLLIPFASAALSIETIDQGSVVITELNNPAKFQLHIDNTGSSDAYEIYSFVGVDMRPKGKFLLKTGDNILDIEARPNKKIRSDIKGYFNFEYQLIGEDNGITKNMLQIKIVDLKDVLLIDGEGIKPGDAETVLTIKNTENTHLEEVTLELESPFFTAERTVSLAPYQSTTLTVPLDTNKLRTEKAGTYPMTATVELDGTKVKVPAEIKYLERGVLSVSESTSGVIIQTKTIEKTNEGNIDTIAEITDTKNLITRLVTSHSIRPTSVESNGFVVTYTWRQELGPGQTLSIETTTNYTLPLLVLIILLGIVFAVKFALLKPVTVQKDATFVRTKGGELALRVRVHLKARTHVDSLQIIDRLPTIMKLYEKHSIKPDSYNEQAKRITWSIPQLNAGEERTYSYIMYSNVRLVGKIQLPPATVVFQKNNKSREVFSNAAFFANEMAR